MFQNDSSGVRTCLDSPPPPPLLPHPSLSIPGGRRNKCMTHTTSEDSPSRSLPRRDSVGMMRYGRSSGDPPSQGREGRRELTESATEFPKASARRRPEGLLAEASEQKPTGLGDQDIIIRTSDSERSNQAAPLLHAGLSPHGMRDSLSPHHPSAHPHRRTPELSS